MGGKTTPEHRRRWKEKNPDYDREYRETNKIAISAYMKKWHESNRGRRRDLARKSKYKLRFGLTLDDYDRLFDAQGGVCLICKSPETTIDGRYGTPFRLAVDHCHRTQKIRGLLCRRCNTAIGLFDDNVELMLSAVDYVVDHNGD